MRIRSHLDPTLFIIFQHVDAREYDATFKDLVRSLRPIPGSNLQPLLEALRDREYRVLAHERYHFWQGLRLPFLHLYAVETLRAAFLGAQELARMDDDWQRWAALGATVPVFDRLDRVFYLAGDRSGKLVFGKDRPTGYELSLKFSAKEMLECAASIFDYQFSCKLIEDLSDPACFKRWCKRNPAYLGVFKFLKDILASEKLVLRIILPLINAAFKTSFPERALAELIARAWGNFAKPNTVGEAFLAQNEPCRWRELFNLWLTEIDYDLPIAPDAVSIENETFYYLDPEQWLGLTFDGAFQHPFLGPLATEWLRRAKTDPAFEVYLDMPGYVPTEGHEFAFAAEPQLRIVRVFSDGGQDKVFGLGKGLIGPAFLGSGFSGMSAGEYRGFILSMLAAYGAFRRATGAQMTDAARTCYHTECPHFDANYCNSYPLIPERFEDCGFPGRLRDWIAIWRR
jgi:hypothetical protein